MAHYTAQAGVDGREKDQVKKGTDREQTKRCVFLAVPVKLFANRRVCRRFL